MKTIGCGLVQFPVMRCYRFFFWKFSLTIGANVVAWQLIFQCTLRLVLLSAWGMLNINYELPITDEYLWAVYVEMGLLAFQIVIAITLLLGIWAENLLLVYPTLVTIPVCLILDFALKIGCYPYLFLSPVVTVFGIFTMIDIWFRAIVFAYCWIVILSYVYYMRRYDRGKALGSHVWLRSSDKIASMAPGEATSPFSRSSTLSRIGRHSFLLKSGKRYKNAEHLRNTSDASEVTIKMTQTKITESGNDDAEQGQLFQNSTPSSSTVTSESSSENNETAPILSDHSKFDTLNTSISQQIKRSSNPPQHSIQQRPSVLMKRGFVPEILKNESIKSNTPDRAERFQRNSSKRRLLDDPENAEDDNRQVKNKAPTLPRNPPVGVEGTVRKGSDRVWSWLAPDKQRNTSTGSSLYNPVG